MFTIYLLMRLSCSAFPNPVLLLLSLFHICCIHFDVVRPCCFQNFTLTINLFFWKKCTRKSCPVLVEEGRPLDFPKSRSYGILLSKEAVHMNPNTEKLRKKYMNNPSEGLTSEDIRHMRGDDLLDID